MLRFQLGINTEGFITLLSFTYYLGSIEYLIKINIYTCITNILKTKNMCM